MRGTNAAGTSSMRKPRKSLICVLAIRTAMPFVNPTTTGRGRYLTVVPMPVTPRITSITPAIIVHMKRPLDAVLRDDGGDDHDERPGRAADLVLGPAERRDDEAGDDRAVDARLRGEPGGDRERHRQRQRDEADRHAGDQVVDEQAAGVRPQRDDRRREPV